MQTDREFRQNIFNNYRVAANNVLDLLGYGWAEYPWEAVHQLHHDWETTKSPTRKKQLDIAIYAMRSWRQWLIELGNVDVPDMEDPDDWFTD